ncbi:MAG: hypothetical protein JWO06_4080 [Bacteroidota bacterium]|nr:hypothetical protein [Bacteroidota bacterium]
MRKVTLIFVLALTIVALVCCKTKEKGVQSATTPANGVQVNYTGPPTIIYKTKGDYSKNVPVTLSADKSKIISYPAPKDVFYNGRLAYPTPLSKGFLLDNRGVSVNTAFLKMTYEEYSKLQDVPKLDVMYGQIIDKDPITEIYNLGNKGSFKDPINDINKVIDQNQLKTYKKLK